MKPQALISQKRSCFLRYSLVISALLALLIIPLALSRPDSSSVYLKRDITGPVFYGVTFAVSVLIFAGYVGFTRKKYIWVLLTLASVCFANVGYLALSLAGNAAEALLANRIAYFGNVYMLLFLIVTIVNACGIRYRRPVVAVLFAISTIMFLFSATQGYLDLFYRNVDFTIEKGYARLLKEYGPAHTLYGLYIIAYLLVIVLTVAYAWKRKKLNSRRHVLMLAIIGAVNVAIWILEKFVPHRLELLSLSYVVNEGILLYVYRDLVRTGVLDDYTLTVRIDGEAEPGSAPELVLQNRNPDELIGQNQTLKPSEFSPDRLRRIIRRLPPEQQLTERELEVTVLLLQNLKRRDIAERLYVSEETVKTHTTHIYAKLSVNSRKSLSEKAKELAEHDGP